MNGLITEQGNNSDEEYTYFAFISCSRKDEKWAKWLKNRLETYKLPSTLQKEKPELPKRLIPVFWDKTAVSPGIVKKELLKVLQDSEFLIIICSPDAACSDYVNYTIEYFKKLGRENNIIPFIVEGSVDMGDSGNECFPLAMLDMEDMPLGIDIRHYGKHAAFLRVVTTLLKLRFDGFNRLHTYTKKRKLIRGIISILLLIMLFILGCKYWEKFL